MIPAHETAAVLRMFRNGIPIPRIMQTLGISRKQLEYELRLAIEDETEAGLDRRPIHDSPPKLVDPVEVKAVDVKVGDYLMNHGFVVSTNYVAGSNTVYGAELVKGQVTVELVDGTRISFEPFVKVSIYVEGRE